MHLVNYLRAALVSAIAVLAFCSQVHAAVQVDDLFARSSEGGKRSGSHRFPVVKGGNEAAMRRINTWLQVTTLGRLPDHPFGGFDASTTSLNFSVTTQTDGYLSLEIDGEYMGAYPSADSTAYSFDLRTGDLIGLNDLFSSNGLIEFEKRVESDRLRQMDQVLTSLRHHPKGSDHELDDEKLGFYSDCRQRLVGTDLTKNQLSLGKNELILSMEMCANHAELALDDLFNYESHYAFSAVKPWLSDYGRCLLIDRKSSCIDNQRQPARGVLHGTMGGRYPITLVFGSRQGNNGYFYDKYGQLIPLDGGPDDAGGYRFTEHLKDGSAAVVTFKRTADGKYVGSWKQELAGKTMQVELW